VSRERWRIGRPSPAKQDEQHLLGQSKTSFFQTRPVSLVVSGRIAPSSQMNSRKTQV